MLASHKRLRVYVHVCMYIYMYVLKALNLKMKVSSAIKCGYKEYIFIALKKLMERNHRSLSILRIKNALSLVKAILTYMIKTKIYILDI